MLSYMLRLNYSYAGKYMLTLTGRSDGYSAFGANNKYAFFPSVAAAWNIASESFMENAQNWLDQLKLRVSYGSNGNQAINPYQTLDRLHLTNYIWGDGGAGVNGAYLANDGVGNPNLKWETTQTFNVGIDYSFFNGRINGNIEMYVANTKDLLMKRTVPIMNGYKTIWDNVGKTRNKGVEFTLNTVNIRNKDFEWSTGIIFSLNRDKIVDLRGDKKMISPINGSSANPCEFTTTMTSTASGRKVTNSPIPQQTVQKKRSKRCQTRFCQSERCRRKRLY